MYLKTGIVFTAGSLRYMKEAFSFIFDHFSETETR